MARDSAVVRLRGEQEPARLGHYVEGYCSIPPKQSAVPDDPGAGGGGR
jgi:hypothetical protein